MRVRDNAGQNCRSRSEKCRSRKSKSENRSEEFRSKKSKSERQCWSEIACIKERLHE